MSRLFRSAIVFSLSVFILTASLETPTSWSASTAWSQGHIDHHPKNSSEVEPDKEKPSDKDKDKDTKKWDVNHPTFPTHDIEIDSDEGTWMSIDVSPDGKEIVFDFLGDLYTIPFGGGEAKSLTQGMAWDEQPRYSPDGKFIAYTSDADGGDNIWIMKRDGSDPKQISKEKFRLLNSPTWTPDSQFIAARKHFTSTRSAGAGEIWLYHRDGGDGLQMTKRPNDQKDLGEPAFSADGRYLYYSQDTTPGSRFQYNKDPNTAIYSIKRLERATGETENFVRGAGGSIRPTPSPDGKSLAFIRRVRYKSVLYVVDIASGKETPLYDGLDRDLQETWAIHGVYPQIAWTPNSESLVFWSGGKINRLNVASKKLSTIPFHIKQTLTIGKPAAFEYDVAPAKFHTKMLRWVTVSPRGDQVVYQALGHLYVRGLPNGTPKRLTKQNDHWEMYPAYSRDGKSIVYTSWDDEDLGAIRVVSARGGKGRVVTTEPGHYVEPVWSPNGKTIVFRKTQGGFLRSALWSRQPGIYQIAATGGKATLITKKGSSPQFGASNTHVYLMRVDGKDNDERSLFSIDLDGSNEHTHVSGVFFTELKLSHDEKWLAFREGFQAYITPFVQTGKGMKIGPKNSAMPTKRVSGSAGEYLHWSGDGQKLYWSLGPELFERNLSESFTFQAGAPEKLPELTSKGIDIGFDADADVPSGKTAFVGARIVTMNGKQVINDGTIVVDGNRIIALGSRGTVQVPSDAKVMDVSGSTIVPGYIDVHWHGAMATEEIVPQQNWMLYAGLAFGVTTVHDPSNDTSEIFASSEMAKAGLIVSARTYSTGMILYGAKGSFKVQIDSLGDAYSHLSRLKAVGAFSVKSYNQPRRNQRQQVMTAAHQLKMHVYPEGGSLFQHNINMVVDGHTGIEHSIPLARVYDDILQLWGQSGVGYTPTLVVGYGGLWGENYWYAKTDVWANERLSNFVPRRRLDARARRPILAPDNEYGHMLNAREATRLQDAGVSVQIGAHGQREGLGAHWEMWMLAQGGMSPMNVLRCATIDGARYLGRSKDLGSIETGKLADFLVLNSNPLDNIRNTEDIRYTVINGRVFDAMTMSEVGNHPRKAKPFFWAESGQALQYQEVFSKSIGCTCEETAN